MSDFPPALPHGEIRQVFDDVFFVSGAMEGVFFDSLWRFSRNMTIVREGTELTLINTVRLGDEGLAALEALGRVKNVVKIGALHGRDDAFYVDRYGATFWAVPGAQHDHGLEADHELIQGQRGPLSGCDLFEFRATKLPEVILRLNREGGILIACDALQNWVEPDEFFFDETKATMAEMGFFQRANIGPVWIMHNEPKPEDFVRLKELTFEHVLCGHGAPLLGGGQAAFFATFARVFNV